MKTYVASPLPIRFPSATQGASNLGLRLLPNTKTRYTITKTPDPLYSEKFLIQKNGDEPEWINYVLPLTPKEGSSGGGSHLITILYTDDAKDYSFEISPISILYRKSK